MHANRKAVVSQAGVSHGNITHLEFRDQDPVADGRLGEYQSRYVQACSSRERELVSMYGISMIIN